MNFARNISHTNIMYLKASADIKISTFLEKNGGIRPWIMKWTFEDQCYAMGTFKKQLVCIILQIRGCLMKNFCFNTFVTLLGNHKNYRDTIVPIAICCDKI